MTCIDFAQIVELNTPQIEALTKAAQENPDPTLDHARRAFSSAVHLVECAIRNTYAMAATLARRTENPEARALLWRQMGELCHLALETLLELKDQYLQCGTPELYDLALDYKLAADERRTMAEEEIRCLTIPMPPGLFPVLS